MALFASTQPQLQSFDAGACAAATLNSCLVACPTGAASLATASGAIVGVEGLEHAQTQLLKAAGPGAVAHAWSADGGCVAAAAARACPSRPPAAPRRRPVGEVKDVAVRALPDGAYEVAVGTFAGVELFKMAADGARAGARDDKAPRAAEPRRCRLARLDWRAARPNRRPARLAKLEARLQARAAAAEDGAGPRAKLEARLQGATIAGAAPPTGFETPGKAAGPATFDAPPPPPP
ncbi:hypothetical protein JL720_4355 [Aureococcus anophagefferens]|nr:hypothetical protein JL720_4355 [Aureococcus anophagefferens]